MPTTFSFAPSQNETFELRCKREGRSLNQAVRSLEQTELLALIEACEEKYYSGRRKNAWGQFVDDPEDLVRFGRVLYGWLDGPEGWLRALVNEGDDLTLRLDLTMPEDMAALNENTQRVALGLAHLPWELLHDGQDFLLKRADVDALLVRQVRKRKGSVSEAQNRPLRLLFMATSPQGLATPLDYEKEEARIFGATQQRNQTLDLVVEESGCVAELGALVAAYEEGYFDVFHITGHGVIYSDAFKDLLRENQRPIAPGTPCFVTEDVLGAPLLSTAQDIAKALACGVGVFGRQGPD